jgi:hypothetical protein
MKMKKLLTGILAGVFTLAMSTVAFAASANVSNLLDGRNGNGLGAGLIDMVPQVRQAKYLPGETVTLDGTIAIAGPAKSLEVFVLNPGASAKTPITVDCEYDEVEDNYSFTYQITLPNTDGTYTYTFDASTKFIGGKKSGLIHSTTAPKTVTFVVETPKVTPVKLIDINLVKTEWFLKNSGKYDGNAIYEYKYSDESTKLISKNIPGLWYLNQQGTITETNAGITKDFQVTCKPTAAQ